MTGQNDQDSNDLFNRNHNVRWDGGGANTENALSPHAAISSPQTPQTTVNIPTQPHGYPPQYAHGGQQKDEHVNNTMTEGSGVTPQRRMLGLTGSVPKLLVIMLVMGLVLISVGMMTMTAANPTSPQPDFKDVEEWNRRPDEYDEKYDEWEWEQENAANKVARNVKVGLIISIFGSMLTGMGLILCGLTQPQLSTEMRQYFVQVGITTTVALTIIPFVIYMLLISAMGLFYGF